MEKQQWTSVVDPHVNPTYLPFLTHLFTRFCYCATPMMIV